MHGRTMIEHRYYTLAEVAEVLRVSEETIERIIRPAAKTDDPIGFKVRCQWRFTTEDIERIKAQ